MDRRTSANRQDAGAPWVAQVYDQLVEEVRSGGHSVVQLSPPRLVVAAPDRRGLLASVVGALALRGLDIQRADVTGRQGVAIDSFIARAGGAWPEGDQLRDDLEAVLAGRLDLAERLASLPRRAPGPGAGAGRLLAPVVDVDNWTSDSCTVVEVHSSDAPGLLYGLTLALFECGLDIVSARVSTFGDAAVDVFYVRTAEGRKVTDPEVLERLGHALHQVVD